MRLSVLCLFATVTSFTMVTSCQKAQEPVSSVVSSKFQGHNKIAKNAKPGPDEALLVVKAAFPFVSVFGDEFHTKSDRISVLLAKGAVRLAIFPENGAPRFLEKQLFGGDVEELTLQTSEQEREVWSIDGGFNNVKLWKRHAQICLTQKKHQSAKALLIAALRQFPKNGDLWGLAARNYDALNKYEAALNAVDRYLELSPQSSDKDEMIELRQKLAARMDDSKSVLKEN